MFIYECKTPKLSIENDTNIDKLSDELISSDIKKIRDEIKSILQTDEPFSFLYPIDDIIGDFYEDKIYLNASENTESIYIKENELGIDEIKLISKNTYGKTVDKVLFDIFSDEVNDTSENKIVLIKNLNMKKYIYRIDELCLIYEKVILLKPRLTNPIDDTVYLLILSDNESKSCNKNKISSVFPTNTEGIIDFMYCMYYYGLYIAKLSLSMTTNINLVKVKNIKMNIDQEYKQYIRTIVDKLRELNVKIQ